MVVWGLRSGVWVWGGSCVSFLFPFHSFFVEKKDLTGEKKDLTGKKRLFGGEPAKKKTFTRDKKT